MVASFCAIRAVELSLIWRSSQAASSSLDVLNTVTITSPCEGINGIAATHVCVQALGMVGSLMNSLCSSLSEVVAKPHHT